MTSEVVIAVRGELKENLLRTVAEASKSGKVCVVFDGDEKGNECPPELKEMVNVRTHRVSGRPLGCGKARHIGISTSEADIIIICDGHMDFPDGWRRKIENHHKRNKQDLTCCRMRSLNQDWSDMLEPVECAGHIRYKTKEPFGLRYALTMKWNKEKKDKGEVSCILGACYAFRKEWYSEIGQPLRCLRAWGGDEELLSLTTHMMGGRVVMLPITVGHIYAAKSIGRIKDADEEMAIWGNRHAVIDALPMEEDERADLHKWIAGSNRIDKRTPAQSVEALEIRKHLSERVVVSFAELRQKGIVVCDEIEEMPVRKKKPYALPPSPPDDTPQVVVRKVEKCDRCGALNSFVQVSGRRGTPTFGVAYARCKHCGHKCQLRMVV